MGYGVPGTLGGALTGSQRLQRCHKRKPAAGFVPWRRHRRLNCGRVMVTYSAMSLEASHMTVVLGTGRLLLRDERTDDLNPFVSYRCRESYWQHMPIEPPTPTSVAERIAEFLPAQSDVPRTLYFLAAVEKDSGEVIGEASMHVQADRSAEFGFGFSDTR